MSRPFRYTFILGLVALATALAAVGGWRYARASAPVNGPIVVVSIDALRADRLPIYGYQKGRTPAIDRLAADGVVFDRAYAHVPLTLPAHSTLLTGRLPLETGVRDNLGFVLKEEEHLVSELLRDRGFATGAVVSSFVLRRETGIGQGFAFFDDELPAADPDNPETALTSLTRSSLDAEEAAERWLDTADTSRLFLFLHLNETPAPSDEFSSSVEAYDARITAVDDAVGRLVRYLKAHQLYDLSTIILVADHGQGLGDHGEQEHGLLVYEESLRVPLVIKQAAGEGAGRRVREVVQQIDLVPTILDLAKAPSGGDLPGQSLKPLLENNGAIEQRPVYSESAYGLYHFGWSDLSTITDGRFRLIKGAQEELFDLQADAADRRNIIDDAPPDVIDRLRTMLKRFSDRARNTVPAQVSNDTRDRLEILGNVGRAGSQLPTNDEIEASERVALVEGYRTAVRLGALKRWPPAIEIIRGLLKQHPRRTDLWATLASFESRANRTEQAISAYRRVLALSPQDTEARLGLATSFFTAGKMREAELEADAILDGSGVADAERRAARLLLVEIGLALHDAVGARQAAADLQTDSIPAADYVEGRLQFDRGRLEDAVTLFEQSLASGSRDNQVPGLYFYLGEALSRLKRNEDAKLAFLRAVAANPDDIRPRASLAGVYRKLGRLDDAGAAISAMTRISPTPETYRVAASLWSALGNERKAALVRAEGQRLIAPLPSANPTQ